MSCVKITLYFSQPDVQDNDIQRLVVSPGNVRRGGIRQLALLQKTLTVLPPPVARDIPTLLCPFLKADTTDWMHSS